MDNEVKQMKKYQSQWQNVTNTLIAYNKNITSSFSTLTLLLLLPHIIHWWRFWLLIFLPRKIITIVCNENKNVGLKKHAAMRWCVGTLNKIAVNCWHWSITNVQWWASDNPNLLLFTAILRWQYIMPIEWLIQWKGLKTFFIILLKKYVLICL